MADPLHGIEHDVTFDFGAADTLATKADLAATGVDGTVGGRNFWTSHAMAEFRGHFSELFQANSTTANTDAGELADALRLVADAARRLKEEAEKENERRRVAREWKAEQDARSDFEEGWDNFWGGGEDPPVGPPADPQILDVPPGSNTSRQTPPPGTGGAAGTGTSSARPSDLRGFVTWMGNANLTRRSDLATTRSAYDDFVAGCRWGSLDADGVLAGFSTWLDANDNDEEWARTVADAFESAGSEGAVVTLSNSALSAALQSAGVDASRQDLTIPAPSAIGNPGTTGYADDPVNTATGNFVENETDLAFDGGCAGLELTRTYNSLTDRAGAFGPGWSSWTESRVRFDDESAALVLPDGREIVFPRLGDAWDRATGESMWLERDGEGFSVRGNDGTRWELARDGALRAFRRPSGAHVHLEHADGHLVRLRHQRGRWIDLVWEADRVVEARSSDDRVVSYTYDEHGRLTAATGALGTRSYGWDEAGLVDSVTSEAGVVEVQNTYDTRGRVARQRSPHGRTSRFAYLPGRVTVVSDEDGTRSNTWIADRRGRLVGVVDAHEHRQSFSYDAWGNRVLVTERDGAVTVSEHDERGRLVRRVTPSGADLQWAFDDQDRVVEVVTEEGAVTRMSYDGDGRSPSLLVDPEGGETRMTWVDGLMSRLVDPTGVEITFTHDGHGDVVAVTAADGGTATFERDAAGRVVVATDPLGHRTTYTYDGRGLLVERHDATGATWRFEHDDAGRPVAEVDPTGARREVEHGPAGDVVRSVDPLGRATTRSYDDVGNLAAIELPDGAVWRFDHDALSRLVETRDPSGATWRRSHDAVGSITSEVDPTGVEVRATADRAANLFSARDAGASLSLRQDRLGRPVAVEGADGSATTQRHDRCGRVVEETDAAGAVTTVERDAAGRVVAVTDPRGGVRRLEHDRTGRLVAVVDPLGGRTTLERDLAGRVVRTTLPDGATIEQDHDALGRVIRRRVAGEGTTRVEYDAAGRVRVVHDPRFGRRTFRHDAVGRVTEVLDAHGGTTRYEYDDGDRVVAVVDPAGGRTERTYDVAGRLVSQTDPLGRTSTASYDAAGRPLVEQAPTGRRLGRTYDDSGRLSSLLVDGETDHTVERDLRARRERVVERLRDGRTSVHELVWDARGLLTERRRDDRTVRWERDESGAVRSVVTPDGRRTTYERDAAGRVLAVEHPDLGRATIERDATGHVVSATAGSTTYVWERTDGGQVVAHTVTDGPTTTRTEVRRDDDGRVVAVVRDGVTTRYEHDAAGQLVAASTDGATTRWRYDAAGRLVAEVVPDGGTVERSYDAAGQLLESRAGGLVTTYSYDAAGRRVRRQGPDGSADEYSWGAKGWLESVRRTPGDGSPATVTALRVDALGELADIDGLPVLWDTSTPAGGLLQLGDTSVVGAGPLTGLAPAGGGGSWATSGWREARPGQDPWSPATAAAVGNGIAVGAGGELVVAGLEWMGARAYDQSTRSFLSTDPLDAVPGSGWAGNPYSFAGNDPLHALDPLGLTPVTDAELEEWKAANGGWMENNWEYVAAAGLVIAGGAMVLTGFGGPVGMGLISAGVDTAIQKYTTGEVNWGQVAVSGAIGTVGAGAAGLAGMAGKNGAAALRTTMAVNGGVGATTSSATYLATTDPDDWSVRGFAASAGGGALAGTMGGLAGPTGGTIARQLGTSSTGVTSRVVTAGLNFGGGFSGSVATQGLSGQEINYGSAALSGTVNAVGGDVMNQRFPSRGTSTLDSNSYFGPRTPQGAFNFHGPNTSAMWGSSIGGAAVGGGSDVAVDAIGVFE